MGILKVITSIDFPSASQLKIIFYTFIRRLPNVPEENRHFCLLQLVPQRLQYLANFTCVRLESDVLFGQKNQWKPILRARDFSCTASAFLNLYRHSWVPPAGRRIRPPARKTSSSQGKRNKLYLLNRLSHGRQAGRHQRRHLTKYCIIHCFYMYREKLRFKLLHFS